MKNTRQRFQAGSLRKVDRKRGFVWEHRYRDHSQPGSPLRQRTLSGVKYPTESKALAAVQSLVMKLNGTDAYTQKKQATVASLIQHYIETERLYEVKATRPGEEGIEGAVQFSTACSYLTTLNRYILPFWGPVPLTDVKPAGVDEWLRSLRQLPRKGDAADVVRPPLSSKTRGHIKSMMHRLFERAMFWELLPLGRNPIALVEVKGVSKRKRKPYILTVVQYHQVVSRLSEPYREMVQVAMCLGLRVSEVLALKWWDFDFRDMSVMVTRKAVHGRIDTVKTECSEDELPLAPGFADFLLDWHRRCPTSEAGWVFPNPNTGQVYHASTIQQDYIRAAGRAANLPRDIGWHAMRHLYRSLLDEAGAPVGVQQKLMRHAHASTTMDAYGGAQMRSKRSANSKVVEMVLPAKAVA